MGNGEETTDQKPDHGAFWDGADDFIDSGQVEKGTMMGHHCLRAVTGGGFVATVERSSGNLVVKLPKSRVVELVEAGDDLPFAPAGKVLREWVSIPGHDVAQWYGLIKESITFVGSTV